MYSDANWCQGFYVLIKAEKCNAQLHWDQVKWVIMKGKQLCNND